MGKGYSVQSVGIWRALLVMGTKVAPGMERPVNADPFSCSEGGKCGKLPGHGTADGRADGKEEAVVQVSLEHGDSGDVRDWISFVGKRSFALYLSTKYCPGNGLAVDF